MALDDTETNQPSGYTKEYENLNPKSSNNLINRAADTEDGRKRRRQIDQSHGRGDSNQAITNNFMGFNHRIAPTLIPLNRERAGLVFFTRPDLNLNEANLRESRRMTRMAEADYRTAEKSILGMLDPLCPFTLPPGEPPLLGAKFHPDVPFDNRQAFIPILTNRLISLSGFPDNTLDVYTSEEGLKREQISMVDSHYAANQSFSLSASFKNLDGDITTQLFTVWLEAMSNFYDGTFIPRARNLVQREINYQTRIYRLIMDATNTYVTKIGIGAAAFPVNDALGAIMNYDANDLVVNANDTLNVQFQCDGAEYLDPILIKEFNEVVGIFNPDMWPANTSDGTYIPYGRDRLTKLKRNELPLFNYYGYPHINEDTNELEWYIDNEDYNRILAGI